MAAAYPATSTALLSSSSNPKAYISSSSHTIPIPSSFSGLRKPSISLSSRSKRRSFGVRAVKLWEYIGKKYVILFLYPLDFTFVCPTEITTAFSDRHEEFETEILGVSAFPTSNHPSNCLPRPKHLDFPPPPSFKHTQGQTISLPLPPIPSPKENNSPPPPSIPSPQNTSESLQEKLLYLDSLGIDSFHCLTSNPPIIQTPLFEIKSVIDFLYSIHLTTHDLRRAISMCPEILTTPLSSTLIPAVTFLLREAHVDSRDLRHVIHRRPRLLTRSVDDTLRPTLYFLQGTIGIGDVSKWAPLLSSSVESKFIPRMEYVQKLGFTNNDTILMFRRFPSLFCYSIESNFEPKFDYFVVEMGRELRELIDFPQYFSFSLENRIKPRHQTCVEKRVVLSLPLLLKSSEAKFRHRLEVCCSSSNPVKTSPLWCTSICNAHFDINVT